jgi:hypothetical protein
MPIYVPGKVVLAKEFTWNETVWNPSMIQTALWLDAADASTVTTVSGAVSQWNDKSGNSRHFSQSVSANRPTLNATAIEGKPAIAFNGTSNSLNAGTAVLPTTHSLFIAFVPTIEVAPGALFGQWQSGATGRFLIICNQNCGGSTVAGRINVFNSTTTQGACVGGSGSGLAVDGAISSTATIIESLCTTGSENWKLLLNGTQFDSATIASVYQSVNTSLGTTSASGNSNYYDGLIAEVVLTASVASADTRQRIEGYLAHKWGLTANLPNNHPYKTVGPTP